MSRSQKKDNKQILEGINYSLDVVKDIKDNKIFTQEGKQEILHKFVGMSKDNNSYFTPVEICDFIRQLLNIENGKVADLSGGIGNMIVPLIKEYGKLHNDITFDLYEFDENNSLAAKEAWSDYKQVNIHGSFDSIERHDEMDSDYDFIIGNPPFSGSVKYWNEWNHNKNGTAKNANIADSFVDMSVRKVKDGGYIALVLPYGHLFKSHGTAKLREWMRSQVALKGIFPLDEGTFSKAGVVGTSVGTCLVIWQKGVLQEEVFMGELVDQDDLVNEMKSMARQFRLFVDKDYEITYGSDYHSGLHGKIDKKLSQWTGEMINV